MDIFLNIWIIIATAAATTAIVYRRTRIIGIVALLAIVIAVLLGSLPIRRAHVGEGLIIPLRRHIDEPYCRLVQHLSTLAGNDECEELKKAIKMMQADQDNLITDIRETIKNTLTDVRETNTPPFEKSVNTIIETTTANKAFQAIGDPGSPQPER